METESVQALITYQVANRINAKDATLYAFDQVAQDFARNFMGWATLASNPPCSIADIKAFADRVRADGFKSVILIGMGGSSQAPMALEEYHAAEGNALDFIVLDSVSPVSVRAALDRVDPETTLVLASSKSGGTIEMRSLLDVVTRYFAETLSEYAIPAHLVAITDPGSNLERRALIEGWRAIFSGEPTVGGRYSALSVFGLVPAALIGFDLDEYMARALEAEQLCSVNKPENPAIQLASFIFDNYQVNRDKMLLALPEGEHAFGLWLEQLVAESVGKSGKGIVPCIIPQDTVAESTMADACLISYLPEAPQTTLPLFTTAIKDANDLAANFVIWEYATAMVGYLMQISPFDQPDVASTKAATLRILSDGLPWPNFMEAFAEGEEAPKAEVTAAARCPGDNLMECLSALFASRKLGDYCSVNAFIPPEDPARGMVLERIRRAVAAITGAATCLEYGPRFLHSVGQLQKGGPNNGMFLVISADDKQDIPLEGIEAASLNELMHAQACGDVSILLERDRRVVHVHLPNNEVANLVALESIVNQIELG